jgi:tetraacyldisaccharide 4'-kinase
MREVKESLPIFYTRMTPSHFFEVANINSKLSLEALCDAIILCVSAIGSANAFVNAMEKVLTFLSFLFFTFCFKIAPCRC